MRVSLPLVAVNHSYFNGTMASKIASWFDETGSVSHVRRAVVRDWKYAGRGGADDDDQLENRVPSLHVLTALIQFMQTVRDDCSAGDLSDEQMAVNLPCLRWDWTYKQAKGIGVKEGDDWLGLAYTLGTLTGARGAILGWSFAPTEADRYMLTVFRDVFTRGKALGLPAPEEMYVDDLLKYERVLLETVRKFWPSAQTRVGQDIWHAIMLLTTCLDRYHPDYRCLFESVWCQQCAVCFMLCWLPKNTTPNPHYDPIPLQIVPPEDEKLVGTLDTAGHATHICRRAEAGVARDIRPLSGVGIGLGVGSGIGSGSGQVRDRENRSDWVGSGSGIGKTPACPATNKHILCEGAERVVFDILTLPRFHTRSCTSSAAPSSPRPPASSCALRLGIPFATHPTAKPYNAVEL